MSAPNINFAKTIPANPGFCVLDVLCDDNGYPVGEVVSHVIAWALEDDFSTAHPITPEGVQTDIDYIMQPDGSVEHLNVWWFPSVKSWLKKQQQEYNEKHGGVS